MIGRSAPRSSDWQKLFSIASDLIDQIRARTGAYDFQWSLGGGTAMMIQINHRQSHDIDLFIEDAQLLGFIDPSRNDLIFPIVPAGYEGDGARFQKFAFKNIGEIDFIVAGALTEAPFQMRVIEGREVKLETVAEIIAKKVYHRGGDVTPRDVFDIAAAAQGHRSEVVTALRAFPEKVRLTKSRLEHLNPDFLVPTIMQLMLNSDYEGVAKHSAAIAIELLEQVLAPDAPLGSDKDA